jgi:hypothetical protein
MDRKNHLLGHTMAVNQFVQTVASVEQLANVEGLLSMITNLIIDDTAHIHQSISVVGRLQSKKQTISLQIVYDKEMMPPINRGKPDQEMHIPNLSTSIPFRQLATTSYRNCF